jgi:hypothetical protein
MTAPLASQDVLERAKRGGPLGPRTDEITLISTNLFAFLDKFGMLEMRLKFQVTRSVRRFLASSFVDCAILY